MLIHTRNGLCLSKKMWLSAALLLTMVLTLLEVFILGHYDPKYRKNTTACLQHKPQTGYNQTVETLISTY